MTSQTIKSIAIAATAAATLTLAGCGGSSSSTTSSGAKIISKGNLTVCTQLPYKPFEFQKNSDVVGFDVDMMDLVAKKLKLKTKIVNTPFEGIQSGQSLKTKKCDVAAAGMTITPVRAKVIDFSSPYFDATQALLTKKKSYNSLDSLAGKKIGVQTGTTGEIYAKKNAPKSAKLVAFEDLGLMTTAVKTGQVDAAVQDNGPLLDYVKSNPDTFVTAEFKTGEQYGFAVNKDKNAKLLSTVNSVIKTAKSDGTYDKVYKKWFGSLPKS